MATTILGRRVAPSQHDPFHPSLHGGAHLLQVLNDLKWNLVRPQGLEAVMRVRCSQGLDISSYSGARPALQCPLGQS